MQLGHQTAKPVFSSGNSAFFHYKICKCFDILLSNNFGYEIVHVEISELAICDQALKRATVLPCEVWDIAWIDFKEHLGGRVA